MPERRIIVAVTAGDTIAIAFETPWNLAGYTVTSTIKDGNGDGSAIASFGVSTSGTNGTLSMSAVDSATYLAPHIGAEDLVFDIKFTAGSGAVTHTEKAFLRVNKAVT